jgi:hypothetical protein
MTKLFLSFIYQTFVRFHLGPGQKKGNNLALALRAQSLVEDPNI